ncbi:PaaX family transcriptional regulator [Aneurinibacillus soli]|uniref:Transcriptional repressor PaaX n=1 Tax=Aneurinibacillus soli TaxID=1500254 RepID=A0A0U5C9V1_9BACL|nr:phenylacetic acid degradation operon negative regulatory protein PaaX [Aneurinibacillus soli]PYE58483.1 PaaX family transcriptional regulator [Aneurinibacillus soli]BAU29459.1 Transcriptional repressor PaaX [Aneurinibacillus soli]
MKSQSMLFTIYGEYVRHYGGEIWVGSITKLMGEFGLSEPAIRAAISRMMKQGWIESRKIGNRSYYRMTSRGKKRLDEAALRIYKEMPAEWDGSWSIVSYNIPEEKRHLRDQLRKELSWMGFGMLANSTWISPHNLEERVKDMNEAYEITPYVEIFRAQHLGWSEPAGLVSRCWNLDEINAAYEEFITEYRPKYDDIKEKSRQREGLQDNECFVEKTKLVHEYRKFLFIDPSLPDELLPNFWLGKEAEELFRGYYDLLHPGAVRFFLSFFESAPVV